MRKLSRINSFGCNFTNHSLNFPFGFIIYASYCRLARICKHYNGSFLTLGGRAGISKLCFINLWVKLFCTDKEISRGGCPVMLCNNIYDALGQSVFYCCFNTLCNVTYNNLRAFFRLKRIVCIFVVLILFKIKRVTELSYIVVISTNPCKESVCTDTSCCNFRNVCNCQ